MTNTKYLALAFITTSACTSDLIATADEQHSEDVICNLPFVELCHPSDPAASQFCATVCGSSFAYCPEYTWRELEYCLRPGNEYTVDSHACYAAYPTAAHLCHLGSGVPEAPPTSGGFEVPEEPVPGGCGDPLSGLCCIRGPWWTSQPQHPAGKVTHRAD